MRAIQVHQFGEPEVLQLAEVDEPTIEPGCVLVETRAIGVNPVDTYVRSGTYPRRPERPYIPGGDAAGVVIAVGEGVHRFAAGDRVYTAGASAGLLTGCYAEKVLCQECQVQPLPENVSFEQGAAVGVPFATAFRALFHRARAVAGESVFVHGASGAVGSAAVQLGAAYGLRIIGSSSSEAGRRRILDDGAEHAMEHGSEDSLARLTELTGGRGPDVIIEMAAHVNLDFDLRAIARFGRIVVVGNRGRVEIDARNAMMKDAAVLGLALANSTAAEMASIHAALRAGLASGTLQPRIGATLPLAAAAEAHLGIEQRTVDGKIVLLP